MYQITRVIVAFFILSSLFGELAKGGPDAPAAILTSNGTGGGDWASVSTWQGGAVPTTGDSVIILEGDSVYPNPFNPATIRELK